MEIKEFKANGKLLLTGEYFVLDGAEALAFPCRFGQTMSVAHTGIVERIGWDSYDEKNKAWFSALFNKDGFLIETSTDQHIAERLAQIFQALKQLNPAFIERNGGYSISTNLSFPRDWGLGTSSTLIAMLAEWAKVNPFDLLDNTFGGSGYDIACANAKGPILYRKLPGISINPIDFEPEYSRHLFFVYLGKKQNSREGIAHYKKMEKKNGVSQVTGFTQALLQTKTLLEFENVLLDHEHFISYALKLERAQTLHFPDYEFGIIKSLGAWGGDFVLATSKATILETQKWFYEKGYEVCIPYHKMVL